MANGRGILAHAQAGPAPDDRAENLHTLTVFIVVRSEDQNFCLGHTRADLPRRFHPIDQRHHAVEHYHIRFGGGRLADRLFAVAGFSHDFPAWLGF